MDQEIKDIIIAVWIFLDSIIIFSLYFRTVTPETHFLVGAFDTTLCIILFYEFTLKIRLKEDKKFSNILDWLSDIAAIIPFELFIILSFPLSGFWAMFLKIGRILRVLFLIKGLIYRLWDSSFFKETKIHYILPTGLIIIVGGALLILVLEEGLMFISSRFMMLSGISLLQYLQWATETYTLNH